MGESPRELFADLVLLNSKIVTVDEKETIVETIATKDGKILKGGFTEETKKTIGSIRQSSTWGRPSSPVSWTTTTIFLPGQNQRISRMDAKGL